jgi:hypothetical protein
MTVACKGGPKLKRCLINHIFSAGQQYFCLTINQRLVFSTMTFQTNEAYKEVASFIMTHGELSLLCPVLSLSVKSRQVGTIPCGGRRARVWADPATRACTPHLRPPSTRTTPLRASSMAVQRFASDAGMDALAPLPAHMVWPCRSSSEFLLVVVGV